MHREKLKAAAWGLLATALLAVLIVVGSRNLDHFDAALVGYTFATLFAAFGITYRYAMWLQRPPTRLYWRRGWQVFLSARRLGPNALVLAYRAVVEFAANRFIFRRGALRGVAHWLIMWGCILAGAITFPLVWGLVHFETVPGHLDEYRAFVFGFAVQDFPVESLPAFLAFHGLVWSAFLVIPGVMLAFRRRMVDHGAVAVQQFGEDVLPLVLLFAISVTGLLLTASYTWMKGYAYDFLAILHAFTVIVTLLWLPFGKFFHVFQRPAQLGVSFYKDAGRSGEQARCLRCGEAFASAMMVRDLALVERQLGFRYELAWAGGGVGARVSAAPLPLARDGAGSSGVPARSAPAVQPVGGGQAHYQRVCPRCRRALFGLAQGAAWSEALGERVTAIDARLAAQDEH